MAVMLGLCCMQPRVRTIFRAAGFRLSGVALLLAGLAGCSTTSPQQGRIAELRGYYQKLPAPSQTAIKKGFVAVGDTYQMVYMAIGKPDTIESTVDGRRIQWIYRNFYPSAAVNNTPLYRVANVDPLQRNLQQWNRAGRPTFNDNIGGNIDFRPPRKTSEPMDAGPDVKGVTLDVTFLDGGVLKFAYNGRES